MEEFSRRETMAKDCGVGGYGFDGLAVGGEFVGEALGEGDGFLDHGFERLELLLN